MIELVDTLPDINVQPAEYKRLLGFPRDYVLGGRPRELADWARSWYARHGRPWVYARQVQTLSITNGSILIDGTSFASKRLQEMLIKAQAHSAILVVVSAGPEVEAESQRLWQQEKPDEYFFLEIFGSSIVEHLSTTTGARLCAWAEGRNLAVLPHYSPGYPDWDIAQQPRLLELIKRTRQHPLPFQIEVMESGMPRPKKSLLGVFGLTAHTEKVRRLTDLVPCENCSFASCEFRRTPYVKPFERSEVEAAVPPGDETASPTPPPLPLDLYARYQVSSTALKRWADERLSLQFHPDGTIDALFRYEGSTCASTNKPILFYYNVKLGPRQQGYPILSQQCGPAPGDEGHRFMCRYMTNSEHLMVAIDREKPLLGQRLEDILSYQRPQTAPSCYCEPSSRKHKWGLVLETIHFALAQRERARNPVTGVATPDDPKPARR